MNTAVAALPTCGHVVHSPSYTWICDAPPHNDNEHWMVRTERPLIDVRTHAL